MKYLFVDLIAIPDFGVGAMENWGLITSRTTSILYDPQETSAAAQQYVAVVIAHEIAHQVQVSTYFFFINLDNHHIPLSLFFLQ